MVDPSALSAGKRNLVLYAVLRFHGLFPAFFDG